MSWRRRNATMRSASRKNFSAISNLKIDVEGDRAQASCYLLDFVTVDGTVHLLSPGQYDCDLVRTPDGWRFTRRLVILDHHFSLPGPATPEG